MWSFLSSYPEVEASQIDGKTYDYIVVGGGTAGCVVASRLSEDPDVSVLVVERGRVGDSLFSRNPLLSQSLLDGESRQVVTDRYSEPIPGARGHRAPLWSAWGVGGASRVNAAIVTRGSPADYTAWADMGLDEWSWERVEPYFRRIENAVAHPDSEARGHDGPIQCRQFDTPFEWGPYLNKAAESLGLPLVRDVNDPRAPAMGLYRVDLALDSWGRRRTPYHAYLNKEIALARRGRLTVCTGAVAARLDIDIGGGGGDDDAGSVRGVHVRPVAAGRGIASRDVYARARREVVVCCGALVTPQVLMLSGLGPRAELAAHGVAPLGRDLPRVGAALADHYAVPVQLEVPRRESVVVLTAALRGLWHLLLWLLLGRGLMRHGSNVNTIFVRSGALDDETLAVRARDDPDDADSNNKHNNNMDASLVRNLPDVEVMIMPCNCFRWPSYEPFLTFFACLVQPFSRGSVGLADADPLSHPRVTHPMLRDARDLPPLRRAVRFAMRLADAFQRSGYPYPAPLAFAPGHGLDRLDQVAPPRGGGAAGGGGGGGLSYDDATAAPALPLKRTAKTLAPGPDADADADDAAANKKTWATVTDAEVDDYASTVVMTSLHTSCTCPISADERSGVVDQRLRVHGLRNLRIADTSVFPRIPSSHTMLPAIMVGERCADFIKEEWAAKSKTV